MIVYPMITFSKSDGSHTQLEMDFLAEDLDFQGLVTDALERSGIWYITRSWQSPFPQQPTSNMDTDTS